MKKPELLAPAGNMETLIMAVNNGADAIYIGGELFSARAFAKNFNKKELKKAVDYCHIYNVKLFVAVNTVIFEDEIEKCLNYLNYLYEINVDAVIMQDIGMISLTRKMIPNLEIHASTQTNCHSEETLKFFKNIGVKRVVLAREMTIDEIKKLKTDIDIEIFIHGALCVSYSGRCLFSSLNGGRSGNRGKCVGSCRIPYEIYKDGKKLNIKYPLSTKELCTANNLDQILKLNISSLKIEGRMKSKEYVGYVTKVYRRIIDDYFKNKISKLTDKEIINLTKLYNRTFTYGYLFNDNIYNTKTSNHQGYPLGKVVKIINNKIHIKLDDELNMEDGIRFINQNKGMIVNKIYNTKGLLVNHLNKGEIAIIDNKVKIEKKTYINKTIDQKLIKEIQNTKEKKIKIDFEIIAKIGKPLTIKVKDNKITIEEKSIILEKAKTKPTTKEEIEEKIKKLGNTPFTANKIMINKDKVFIPLKKLNELRHTIIEKLIKEKTKNNKKIKINYQKQSLKPKSKNITYKIQNEKQLLKYKNHRLYTENYNLYKKYKYLDIYYKLPEIMNTFPDYKNEKLLVSELGSINKYYKDNTIITDYPLNITNSESAKLLKSYNVKIVTISPEVSNYELLKYIDNAEIIRYAIPKLMIIKDFYLKGNITIKNKFGNIYPIKTTNYTTVYHHKPIDKTNEKIITDSRIELD